MLLGRRLCQLALVVIIAAMVTNCSVLWGGPVREIGGSGNLDLILWVSRSLPSVGQPVQIKYTVKNPTDRTEIIQLEEKQGPVMNICIGFGAADMTIECWSDGREITPEMRRLELAPGESKTIEMTWVPDAKADGYPVSVNGILNWGGEYPSYVPVHICVDKCPVY